MNPLDYTGLFILLFGALLGSLNQMAEALDDVDIDRFSIWTCVAAVIAFVPTVL